MQITIAIKEVDAHNHHHETPTWQKVCFPIWAWKAMIHDKHEAFRFKYDTVAIQHVETELMPGVKKQLYMWTVFYYFIIFGLPLFFYKDACYETFEIELFFIFGFYLLACGIWEVWTVLKIQRLLNNKDLLKFNSWHVIELFMGSIARTDTFLDVIFVYIVGNCISEYTNWFYPTVTFAVLNILFPCYMLFKLIRNDFGNALFQPYLESTCFASFIRENMLLATVLDSFCINNSFYVFGYPLVFGKLMGFLSFFTQDFPQLTIHVIFKLIIYSDA